MPFSLRLEDIEFFGKMLISHKLCSAKKNGHQSAIFDPNHLKSCTLICSMIVYKFPIFLYKLWSWVAQIMKVMIFGQIQKRKMAAIRPSWIWTISNFAHWHIQWLSTSFLFITYINYDHGHTNYESSEFRPNSAKKWPPVGHLGYDPSQILHSNTFNGCPQVSYSLCI